VQTGESIRETGKRRTYLKWRCW